MGPLLILFAGGDLIERVAQSGSTAETLGRWMALIGLWGLGASFVLGIIAFPFARPHRLLPPGLRGQPGFLWDRGPIHHQASVTDVRRAVGDRFFMASCECGWVGGLLPTKDEAREIALGHTANVADDVKVVHA